MSESTSNIRVFVQWKEPTVFAGEHIECKITFKNVAPVPTGGASGSRQTSNSKPNGLVPRDRQQRKPSPLQAAVPNARQLPPQISRSAYAPPRGHRPALSLNLPSTTDFRGSGPGTPITRQAAVTTPGHKHVRSLSIRSLGGSEAGGDDRPNPTSTPGPTTGRRQSRSHARSASLQVVPKRGGVMNGSSYYSGQRSATQPSPFFNRASSPLSSDPQAASAEYPFPAPRHSRRVSGVATAPNTPGIARSQRPPSGSFRFPSAPVQSRIPHVDSYISPDAAATPTSVAPPPLHQIYPRPTAERASATDKLAPVTKVLAASSVNGGTPRSSGEFYSMSNNSSETLASEYTPQASNRLLQRPPHLRRGSQLSHISTPPSPEVIMMGYAKVSGSFTLDGSLVNQAPFEEVKRRGVLGGQGGGGVVGVESNKRDSGMFGAFGWSNLGESIGGLLGGGELSSIKEMRGIASSKTIPLLSTPQSILFVDLRLGPGESKSYSYSFPLPTGLPPSHRGKAIKISYTLVIGTQRPSTKREQQQVRHVDIPFRVFSGVNGLGEVLGHDLMSPHVLLKDKATTKSLLGDTTSKDSGESPGPESSLEDFLAYVDNLIERPRHNSSAGLLSPTETRTNRRSSFIEEPASVQEAIDLAILRSNATTSSERSANRFDIARSGRRVAALLLPRPAFRLGETITAVIDFSQAHIPCYAIHAALETSETVDPALALRSDASIYRVTRKTYATQSESTLFAQRVTFAPTIPTNATPDFITSGISLEWKLRIEFVTPRITAQLEDESYASSLLESLSRDERGLVLAAREDLVCESFEVTIPLRVYGTPSSGVSKDDLAHSVGLSV